MRTLRRSCSFSGTILVVRTSPNFVILYSPGPASYNSVNYASYGAGHMVRNAGCNGCRLAAAGHEEEKCFAIIYAWHWHVLSSSPKCYNLLILFTQGVMIDGMLLVGMNDFFLLHRFSMCHSLNFRSRNHFIMLISWIEQVHYACGSCLQGLTTREEPLLGSMTI